MRLLCGSPAFHYLVIFIQDRKLSTRNLLVSGDICLADLYLCHIVLHFMLLDFRSILDGKFDAFCGYISICRFGFCHCVGFADYQLFDHMGFFCGYPFIHHIAVLIGHFQVGTGKLIPCCQVRFCQFHGCSLIFKGKIIAYLCLIRTGIFKGEILFLIGGHKTIRSIQLFHIIVSVYRQVCRKGNLTVFIRGLKLNERICFQQDITAGIFDILPCKQSEDTACQYTLRVFFLFQDGHFDFLAVVLPCFIIRYHRGILVTVT